MAANSEELLRRKQQVVQDAIWNAAIDLFGEKGFDATTVDDIAAAAGVSQRTFFRYFASKSDLMGQSMLAYGEMLRAAINCSGSRRLTVPVSSRTGMAHQLPVGALAP